MSKNVVYLSGLNGLRAIAALSVMLGHITSRSFTKNNFGLPPLGIGYHGVTLFFVISGFLITYLLLLEQEKVRTIEIKKFYFRRILRIWPIYYLYILVCLGLAFFLPEIRNIFSINLFYYLFFFANVPMIFHFQITIIGHYWSIGVEEQFYLIWPWLVKFVNKRLLSLTFCLVIVLFVLKICSWIYLGNNSILYKALSFNRFHCMLVGSAGAIIFKLNKFDLVIFLTNKFFQQVNWLLFILLFFGFLEVPVPISAELMALISVVIILGQVSSNKLKVVNLEKKYFDLIGKISYGIYVIHPIVIFLFGRIYKNLNLDFILQIIVVYGSISITTLLLAYLSYEYFEKRFLLLKKKYAIIQSSNSKDD